MIFFLLQGLVLGLSAGFAPGPLLALVVSETFRHGPRAGFAAALAPLVTDLPIVIITMLVLARLSHLHQALGWLSLFGAVIVFAFGVDNLRATGLSQESDASPPRSLRKGIAINALSPHPYLFWITVGGPLTWRAWEQGPIPAFLFIGTFYLLLVGSKLLIAAVAGHYREFLSGRVYLVILRLLGVLLCALALLLARDGLVRLGIL